MSYLADKHDGDSGRESCSCTCVIKALLTRQIYVLIRHEIVILLQDEALLWVKVDSTQVGVVGTRGCPTAENPSTGTPLEGAAAKGNGELCVLEAAETAAFQAILLCQAGLGWYFSYVLVCV